jgi:hypothetical protein
VAEHEWLRFVDGGERVPGLAGDDPEILLVGVDFRECLLGLVLGVRRAVQVNAAE